MKRDTGARALRAVIDEVMLGFMYDLPELDNEGCEYVIDEAALQGSVTLEDLRLKRKESA